MNAWMLISYTALLFITAAFIRGVILRFLTDHGVTENNYRNQRIPSSVGVLIWLTSLAALLLSSLWTIETRSFAQVVLSEYYKCFFLALTIVFILGWTDDLIGDRRTKGLRGHLRLWLRQGQASTGLLKALGTSLISAWLVVETGLWQGGGFGLLPFLIMILYTHALNLFDLRPGRALKVFLFGTLSVILLSIAPLDSFALLAPVVAGALVLLPVDLRGEGMLGDTGANMLGFTLGSVIAFHWPWSYQLMAVIWLTVLALLAERYSLTQLIERIPLLNWLDRLGRE